MLNAAEGAGFEPAIRLPVYTLSRRAPSTTRPPLHARFRGAAEGSERPPYAQCGAARMDELSLINERPVGPPGRAAYDFRSGPARAMTCISPSAPAIATL